MVHKRFHFFANFAIPAPSSATAPMATVPTSTAPPTIPAVIMLSAKKNASNIIYTMETGEQEGVDGCIGFNLVFSFYFQSKFTFLHLLNYQVFQFPCLMVVRLHVQHPIHTLLRFLEFLKQTSNQRLTFAFHDGGTSTNTDDT